MNIYTLLNVCLILNSVNSQFNPTELEKYIVLYRQVMYEGAKFMGKNSENVNNLRKARELNMLQEPVPISVPFPCNVTGHRSLKPPTNVHELRPGDIDVIGALGDSLTAGFGLVATTPLQVLIQNRGLSWSIGGQGTWREYVTLPNILKEFNPNLFGYSLQDSLTIDRESQFNPAEGAAISNELPYMTKILIKRITRDPRVNIKQHWKLITIMIGANDFCLDICYKKNAFEILNGHRKDLIEILSLLRNHLPRTVVNIVPPPDVRVILNLKNSPQLCTILHKFECFCLIGTQFQHKKLQFFDIIKKWQLIGEEVSQMPEFNQNDFTVNFQPFLLGVDIPKINENQTDFSYMSQDCFHVSQKMNAEVALSYWNNLLEKVGSKTPKTERLFSRFLCPSEENPYIYTRQNSR